MPVQVPNHVHELKQANRLIRDPRHLRAREQECVDQIIDVENTTHLLASPQSVIVCPSRARIRKCDPALIFIIYLMRSVNAAHAKYHRRQAKRSSVVDDVLVCNTFGTAVRAV
jgi:hypothetical protein